MAHDANYDDENIFAKILRGQIPCKQVESTEHSLAFWDVKPQAPVHILVIPRGPYVDFTDFSTHASTTEIDDFFRLVGRIAQSMGVERSGYRLLVNAGQDGGQEVPHFHVHLCGGRALGRTLESA